MHRTTDAPPAVVTHEGETLRTVFGRLVRWHHTVATAEEVTTDMQRHLLDGMMATLKAFGENLRFGAADAARRERDSGARASPSARVRFVRQRRP